MYKVILINDSGEKIINETSPDNTVPHLLAVNLTEQLNGTTRFSFTMPSNSPCYSSIQALRDKIKVYENDALIFNGRVLNVSSEMNMEGQFFKEVVCESSYGYLHDTNARRQNFTNKTPSEIFTTLLNQHNAKVDDSKKIYLGTVELYQPITIDFNYEETIQAIIKVRNILGGDIRVRETGGLNYLDYLTDQGEDKGLEISLGVNQQSLVTEHDATDLVTQFIPLGYGEGINQLDIKSVNGGLDYVSDSEAIAQYGVIEGQESNIDIQNAGTLKTWGLTVLSQNKQPKFSMECEMVDLSFINPDFPPVDLGDTIHIVNEVMNIDVYARVIEKETDLYQPWNPRLVISTRPIKLSNQIIELQRRSFKLENAPQGNTYIDTYGYSENIDGGYPLQLPIWISPDVINVNRVRLHIDSQKFRAYNKDVRANSQNTATVKYWKSLDAPGYGITPPAAPGEKWIIVDNLGAETQAVDRYGLDHQHIIPSHQHAQDYGIFEDTYPRNIYIKINGETVAGPFATSGEAVSKDIDLTPYVSKSGETYNLEITSDRNGRVNAWVSLQAFIQSK